MASARVAISARVVIGQRQETRAMATYSEGFPERRAGERRRDFYPAVMRRIEGLRVSWAGVWGGVLVAMGMFLLLTALGIAIGRTVESIGAAPPLMGLIAGAWAAVSLLASLFVGGVVSTRAGGVYDRTTGFFEGALVWVMSVLLMFFFAATGVSTVASGMFGLIGAPAAVAPPERIDLASGDVDEILGRLRDTRMPQRISGATGIPENESQLILAEIAQRVEAARNDPVRAREEARRGAADLYAEARVGAQARRSPADLQAPPASRAAWITFGALVLSLGAAVTGAMVGRRTAVARAGRRAVD
jgi:hypothetical protein